MGVVEDIEEAFFAHWAHFGRWPAGSLHDEGGVLWFETPIRHLPYNGVIRTSLEVAEADARIREVTERFRRRGAESFWMVHPSARPSDLATRLPEHGLRPVETLTGMSLELSDWEPAPAPAGVVVEEVVDEAGMLAYTDLTMSYWEIPSEQHDVVRDLHMYWGPDRAPGHRYIAYVDGEPAGKAYVSLAGPPGVAAVFGMSVRPEARGRGLARALTTSLLQRARERRCHRAVLHSTDVAARLYSRAGFTEHCELTAYATADLWTEEH